jgi:hypothetical protein
VAFRSTNALHSWLITNANGALAFIEIGGGSNLAYEAAVTKAGYVSPEEAAYQDSYKSNLPKVFGKSAIVGGTRGDTRVLPGIKTNADFESGLGFQSYKLIASNAVKDKANLLRNKAMEDSTTVGFAVASTCISHSEGFVTQLLQWMSTTYTALCKQS